MPVLKVRPAASLRNKNMPQKIYNIKVVPNSKVEKLVSQEGNTLRIKLQAPAHDGKANKALLTFLSLYFKVPKNKIKLISGEKSRDKKVAILI
jgi:uncharacterized protein (TIGR00251 family)